MRRSKAPACAVLLVMACTLVFLRNMDVYLRAVTPHIGAWISGIQADMQRAAHK